MGFGARTERLRRHNRNDLPAPPWEKWLVPVLIPVGTGTSARRRVVIRRTRDLLTRLWLRLPGRWPEQPEDERQSIEQQQRLRTQWVRDHLVKRDDESHAHELRDTTQEEST